MCNCGGGAKTAEQREQTQFIVTYGDGRQKVVQGEHAAKVETTMDPKAVYRAV